MPRNFRSLRVARDVVPYVLDHGAMARQKTTLDEFIRDPQRIRILPSRQLREICGRAFAEIKALRAQIAGGAR